MQGPDAIGVAIHAAADPPAAPWPRSETGAIAATLLAPLLRDGCSSHISNANVELGFALVGETVLPLAVAEANYDDTYPVSIFTHYVSYPIVEYYRHLRRPLAFGLASLTKILGGLLRRSEINRAVYVNSWPFSTTLYPELAQPEIDRLHLSLVERFPGHAIVFRSLTQRLNGALLGRLLQLGYRQIFARQVYLRGPGASTRKSVRRHLRKDRELLRTSGYELVQCTGDGAADATRLRQLYELLYIEKYARLNPRYSDRFFRTALANRSLDFHVLRRDGRVDAVMGLFRLGKVLTAPIFGYDTGVDAKVGLYRMLSAATLAIAEQDGLVDHASSGVAGFKRIRGYDETLEFSAVFTAHLPMPSQRGWRALEWCVNRYGQKLCVDFERSL